MTLNKTKGDIFSLIGYDIVFAIDATFECDVGICKQLNQKFNVQSILKAIPVENSKWKGKGYCASFTIGTQTIHALVVKSLPNKIPDYDEIENAIISLASSINHKNSVITPKIAMPHICCGEYDKRDWNIIEKMVENAFQDIDCEILIVDKN